MRNYPHSITLKDGRQVGYSLLKRPKSDYFYVRFPALAGKTLEKGTGYLTKNDAHTEARKIIETNFGEKSLPGELTWDKVREDLKETPMRTATLRTYLSATNTLQRVFHCQPKDIDEEQTRNFHRLYVNEPSKKRKRGNQTAKSLIKTCKSLWNKHFKTLYGIKKNPWNDVPFPLVESKLVHIPAEQTVTDFFAWLKKQFPFFKTIHLFCEVKALIGCRTLDLCSVKSAQLQKGRLILTATQSKHRKERSIMLPPDLFMALNAIKGDEWLWERYCEEAPLYSKKPHKVSMEFRPSVIYWAIRRLFTAFNAKREDKILPHDLRRRAITLTTRLTGSLDETAHAIGVTPETARRHYLDAERAFQSDETMRKMAGILRPKTA
ncbi:MAG: hypothetical protein ACJ8C4_18610 [Gemmataceae bacterium]